MKVLKTVLVNHTKKESDDAEVRFYVTQLDEVCKGDIFAVWAHGKLAYAKVKKVYARYEYLASENNGVALDDVPQAMNRIDFKSYNIFKAVAAKTKRLTAILQERLLDGRKEKELADAMAGLRGQTKIDVKAICDELKAIEADPESALDNED